MTAAYRFGSTELQPDQRRLLVQGRPVTLGPRAFEPRRVALRNRERLLALLSAERSADAQSRLYDEGCRLTDDQACALAFPPLAAST